jgi:hypothetical protein
VSNRNNQPGIPTPANFIGHEVGEDRKLADWPTIVSYFWLLDQHSDRINVVEVGRSTEDNPFLMATIAAPDTLADLERYREIQAKLADPRGIKSADEVEKLISTGKSVILVTCSVHGTEVGATQMSMLLAYDLATSDDPRIKEILDNVIFLLIPSLNPDGLQIVKSWYDSTLGTWYEGVYQPFLYHKYVGHDNNRDWFMFTQRENRLAIQHAHNQWHPQVVYDLHQMGPFGPRFFLPPYVDPIDPNVDPILQSEIVALGSGMASELIGQRKPGVAVYCIYDAFSPSRAYQHYHGGIRILSEAASCRIATPIDVKPEQITFARGIDSRLQTWNNPIPWSGGKWTLKDIVDYEYAAVLAALSNLARNRETWLRNFYAIGLQAVSAQRRPYAYLVPKDQLDPITTREMLEILRFADVEIHEAQDEFLADGLTFPSGTSVILTAQPYGSFAKTMLEVQHYPNLLEYPGGPPKRPYDVTAHSLPLQMGVDTVEIREPFDADLFLQKEITAPIGRILPVANGVVCAHVLPASTNASFRAANRLLRAGARVSRISTEMIIEGVNFSPGAYVIEGGRGITDRIKELTHELGLEFTAVSTIPSSLSGPLRQPRVGLYKSWAPTAEEGWTRWVLEEYEAPYTTIVDQNLRSGQLKEMFDVIVLPHQPSGQLMHGNSSTEYPAQYAGGVGQRGSANLISFVENGGTIVAWDGAAEYALEHLELPVTNALAGISSTEFYAPGTFFRVLLDTDHPVAYGMPSRVSVMFERSPVFEPRSGTVIGRYPSSNPLLSGWVLGKDYLHGKAALVEVPVGKGRVILIGFKVHFRAQARGTYRVLFNSLLYSVSRQNNL